jgi:hypothetical protein
MTVDFAYSVAGLGDAARCHDDLSGAAAGVASLLQGLTAGAGSLGEMDAAAAFVSAMGLVAGGLARAAEREATARSGQSVATSTTARLGELLDTDTEAMARAATPAPLSLDPPLNVGC